MNMFSARVTVLLIALCQVCAAFLVYAPCLVAGEVKVTIYALEGFRRSMSQRIHLSTSPLVASYTLSARELSVAVHTLKGHRFRGLLSCQDIWAGLLVLFPIALVVEHAFTDRTNCKADFLSLMNGFKMRLKDTFLSGTFEDHLAHWALQSFILN